MENSSLNVSDALRIISDGHAEPFLLRWMNAAINGDNDDAKVAALAMHAILRNKEDPADNKATGRVRRWAGLPPRVRGQDPRYNPDLHPLDSDTFAIALDYIMGRKNRQQALSELEAHVGGSPRTLAQLLDDLCAKFTGLFPDPRKHTK
ncbi:hypothetical protein [Cupriavidus sp. Agwp_2]|uniref:hypothetical protein n=1 Tax=Cupriavidus sp. Agwp_2 TaxID=2897324 RepID=UPI0034604F46